MVIETSAYQRTLTAVSGYELKNTLNIIVINAFEDEINDSYTALLYLANTDDSAFRIYADSRIETVACTRLAEKIADYCSALQGRTDLSRNESLHKSYLESILRKK